MVRRGRLDRVAADAQTVDVFEISLVHYYANPALHQPPLPCSVLPERLRHRAPRGAGLGVGEVLHAVRGEPPGLVIERLDRDLKGHRPGQRQIGALVQNELGPAQGDRILRRQHLHQGVDFVMELVRGAHPVDQVIALGDLGREELTDEVPLLDLAPASETTPFWAPLPPLCAPERPIVFLLDHLEYTRKASRRR